MGDGHVGGRGDDLHGVMGVATGRSVDTGVAKPPRPDRDESAPAGAALSHSHAPEHDPRRPTPQTLTLRYLPLSSPHAVASFF